jgi:putative protein kinase ArgK-like GTPase of G3E family
VETFADTMRKGGGFEARRSDQSVRWLWQEVSEELLARFRADPWVAERKGAAEGAVAAGRMMPTMAAETLLKGFLDRTRQNCINGNRDEGSGLYG